MSTSPYRFPPVPSQKCLRRCGVLCMQVERLSVEISRQKRDRVEECHLIENTIFNFLPNAGTFKCCGAGLDEMHFDIITCLGAAAIHWEYEVPRSKY